MDKRFNYVVPFLGMIAIYKVAYGVGKMCFYMFH